MSTSGQRGLSYQDWLGRAVEKLSGKLTRYQRLAELRKRAAKRLRVQWRAAMTNTEAAEKAVASIWAKYRKEVDALTNERDALKLSVETLLDPPPDDKVDPRVRTMTQHLARIIGRQRHANRKLQQAYNGVSAGHNQLWHEAENLKFRLSEEHAAFVNAHDAIMGLARDNAALRAKLERVRAFVQDSLHPRHGPGGCGMYAGQLMPLLDSDTPAPEPPALTEARDLLARCSDEFNFDEFDDPVQLALQHDVRAWLAAHPEPEGETP